MSQLPSVSGREVVKALTKVDCKQDRQRQETYPHRRIVVPDHREIARGTLRAIIREAGLTIEEFKGLL